MLPIATTSILIFLGYQPENDFDVSIIKGGIVSIERWDHADPQPTEQEIIDTGNSAEFLTWQAEHGGDPLMTLRRQAREALDDIKRDYSALLRAQTLTVLDEINLHAERITAILDAIDSANNIAQLQTNVGAIPDVPTRTGAQVRTSIKAKLTAGDADT